jgi:hypothetical protein
MMIILHSVVSLLGIAAWILAFCLVLMETGKRYLLIKFFLAPLWAGKILLGHILPMFQDPAKW